MLLLGDICFGESYSQGKSMARLRDRLAIEGYGYSLTRLGGLMRSADLVIGNLEVPLSTAPNAALQPAKQYLHWCDPDQTISCLAAAGIDALSLANNHSLDCGESGLYDTLSKAGTFGIATFGAGRNLQQAAQPFVHAVAIGPITRTIVTFGGFEFRSKYADEFHWYAGADHFGTCAIDPATIAGQVKIMRASLAAPMFIAFPHWGADYQEVKAYQRDMAAQLIDAGIDLVVGHGAHVLQGLEAVNGRPILYGLGNFVFNSPGRFGKMRALPYGLAAALRFRAGNQSLSASLRLYPLLIDNEKTEFQNRPVSDQEFPEVLSLILKYYDGQLGELKTGYDSIGHYIDVPVET
jgi:cyanophycin synthetase